ncbi:MAG: LacI family DNA-binding transcriptional regulator [Rhizobiaceae bacterium]|nr:LacI family DNA-binding transcriptional regulator [Rhizobiaceae bacterium]
MSEDEEGPRPTPTIREVASAAGVSLGSVSRVLNGHATVTPDIRAKVEKAVAQLGFKPNAVAQSMRSGASRTVGCIIRDINIPGLAGFVRSAHDVLLQEGYALLLTNSEGDPKRERELISVMMARRADALLLGHWSEQDQGLENTLREVRFPVVLMDREEPRWADSVMVDHKSSIRHATQMLAQLGHKRIALITGRDTLYPARSRIEGYREGLLSANLPFDPRLIHTGTFEAEFGYESISQLLDDSDRPTAVIAGGIEMMPGVLRSIRTRGLSIPHDISLVGTLNSPLAEFHQPPISVEDWDYAKLGRIAAKFALDRIRGEDIPNPRRFILPSEIVMRGSCAPPPR